MFEETKPVGQTGEPKDIFQEIEPMAQAPASQPVFQPIAPQPSVGGVAQGMSGGPKEPLANLSQLAAPQRSKFWLWLVVIIIIIAILVAAGWYFYIRFFNQQAAAPADLPITNQNEGAVLPEQPIINESESSTASTTAALEIPSTSAETIIDAATVDTDVDGLPDAQEQTLGTDPNNPDTDADNLTDREEVVVYKTNPLKVDTDGDGYADGAEVKNGYNPAGPGKLLDLQKALQASNTPNQLP